MTSLTLSKIQSYLQAEHLGEDTYFQTVSIDSRTIQPGSLFVAIKGKNFDGHDYLQEARTKGAVAAIVDRQVSNDIPVLIVSDTRKALGRLASFQRQQMKAPVIAITGSNGKTTAKNMLASILSINASTNAVSSKQILVNQKNFNNDIGVPLTLLEFNSSHQFAVLELGANHFGEIAYLTDVVQPDIAVILNIGPAHLEGFGDLSGVAKAKSEIFQGLKEEGVAIFNNEEPFANYFRQVIRQKRIVTFGMNSEADIRGDNIKILPDGLVSFELKIRNQSCLVHLPTLGVHNVGNALAAATCADVCGIDISIIQQGLSSMIPVEKRLSVLSGKRGARIIDDSYSAIPNAVSAALQTLAHFPGEKIFVFGGMAELGDAVEAQHQSVGEQARSLGIQHLLAVGSYSHLTVQAFGERGRLFASKQELIDALEVMLHKNTTVLIKGSRGARMEEVVAATLEQ